jgi:predicted metal-binding membrane protein
VERLTLRGRTLLVASLLGAALVAWIVTVQRMRGMDAGPGTDLGPLGWYLGIWVTMMAAMMLPSTAPTVLMFARARRGAQPWAFVFGYLVAWTGYGLVAYGVYRGIRAAAPSFLAWDEGGPWVAGGALATAGLYQLTPLKAACLRHCRSPLHFLLRGRPGRLGALWMGIEHGGLCVGCCTGLMLALFALGVMSLFWMVVVAAAILVEKVLPGGETSARLLAVGLVALGIWVATSPASVPGLTQPGRMQMQRSTGGLAAATSSRATATRSVPPTAAAALPRARRR